jgi:hypothetical protein
LLANRSFVPRELTLSEDPRQLSFRLIEPGDPQTRAAGDAAISA